MLAQTHAATLARFQASCSIATLGRWQASIVDAYFRAALRVDLGCVLPEAKCLLLDCATVVSQVEKHSIGRTNLSEIDLLRLLLVNCDWSQQ